MKKIFSIAAFVFCLVPSAHAWFPMQAYCQVTPAQASCSVYNPYPHMIFCQGRAVGTTYSGMTFWSGFNQPVYPFTSAFAYVRAANPWADPLTYAASDIWCR